MKKEMSKAIIDRYSMPKTEVLKIPVEAGRNVDCEMEDCKWNNAGKCKSLAIDIKKDKDNEKHPDPICETYSPAGRVDDEDAEDKPISKKDKKEKDE